MYPRNKAPFRDIFRSVVPDVFTYGKRFLDGVSDNRLLPKFLLWAEGQEKKKTSITLGRENILNSKREDPSLLVNKKKLTYKNIVGRGKTKN
ncbi:hypothetical protein P5673_009809 [Acropora cervicornis]|uniref:Uncharacterized protein n=1 Tax=Acropora cervicornis TaxID=6130 RepID=A0AAD9QRR6_ACRCE|nr:hypothetical protein P5673_009809 [Acropora cervicornis]